MTRELLIRFPDGTSRTLGLEGQRLTAGRSRTSEINFPEDPSLSRVHFVLERDGDDWTIEDMGSKNGTLVDGVRVSGRRRLKPGSRIEAGQVVLIYEPSAQKLPEEEYFYQSAEAEIPKGTIMTNLQGLLSGERTTPLSKGAGPAPEIPPPARLFANSALLAVLRAGEELGGDRPLSELFHRILALSMEAVGAERAFLATLEGDRLVPQAVHGDGFKISSAVRDRVLQSGTSLLVNDVLLDENWSARQSISEQQVRTMMAVPLQTKDRVIGMIYLDSRFFVREFTPDDLTLLTVFANVAAIRIEQERLRDIEEKEKKSRHDLEQAAIIQRGFLPLRAPSIPGLDVAGHNAACRTVGGDYYDFFGYPDGRLGMVLGDVSGKGLPASLVMTSLHATVHMLAEEPDDLARLVSRLDRFVASHCPTNRFVSLFFSVLDSRTGAMTYCNAGHNPPFLVRADGSIERLKGGGTVLGIMPDLGYEERRCQMDPGDMVVLYSDGVSEASNPQDEEFGEDRLAAILRASRTQPAEIIVEKVNAAVAEWGAGAPVADDVTLVVVRRV